MSDERLMYAAHRAAGGITSIYRQIGIATEQLFRLVIQDTFGLSDEAVRWSYAIGERNLALDAKIQLSDLYPSEAKDRFSEWLQDAARSLEIAPEIRQVLRGAVFEVRQGYKSKDSKRQNADIANAATAYSQGFLPVLVLLSDQIDRDVVQRYKGVKWLVLQGYPQGNRFQSTYTGAFQDFGKGVK